MRRTHLDSGEEEQRVVVFGECINGSKHALEIRIVVGCGRVVSIERIERAVYVQREVDARAVERSHARIVVCVVINSVDTDCVDSKLLKFCNVAFARAGIRDWVGSIGRSTWLIIHTTDVEAVVTGEECYRSNQSLTMASFREFTIPLPLTVTAGKLPELLFEGGSSCAGVATACTTAAEAAARAIATFIM